MTLPRASGRPDSPALDRAAEWRDRPGILDEALAAVDTRVLILRGGSAPLSADGRGLELRTAADAAPVAAQALLGRDERGGALLLVLEDEDEDQNADADDSVGPASWAPPGGWHELRAVGGALRPADADLATLSLSLARWLRDTRFCAACGGATELRQAGWSRRCPDCGREHFPRTDPAVIVAVTDGARLLLGSNAAWPAGRYSCFAGFVEAGESAEAALEREVFEEAGVRIERLEYVGSQAWPYPRSLMLGYLAHAARPDEARPDGSEIVEVRWFDVDEIGAALAGDGPVTLPGPASISRSLIERWHARVSGR